MCLERSRSWASRINTKHKLSRRHALMVYTDGNWSSRLLKIIYAFRTHRLLSVMCWGDLKNLRQSSAAGPASFSIIKILSYTITYYKYSSVWSETYKSPDEVCAQLAQQKTPLPFLIKFRRLLRQSRPVVTDSRQHLPQCYISLSHDWFGRFERHVWTTYFPNGVSTSRLKRPYVSYQLDDCQLKFIDVTYTARHRVNVIRKYTTRSQPQK